MSALVRGPVDFCISCVDSRFSPIIFEASESDCLPGGCCQEVILDELELLLELLEDELLLESSPSLFILQSEQSLAACPVDTFFC